MKERRHQVKFTLAARADQGQWTRLTGASRFNGLQQIERRISDSQKVFSVLLLCACLCLVREIDRRSFEFLAFEFVALLELNHCGVTCRNSRVVLMTAVRSFV
jgi:hypothetical protein